MCLNAGSWKGKQPQYKWAAGLWVNLEIKVGVLSGAVNTGAVSSQDFIPFIVMSPGGSNKSDTCP